MERVQAAVSSATDESSGACVSCHNSVVDGPRCSHCGATQAAGGYRALKVIAQTAHSRMYLAEDESGRKVALKELMFALVPGVEQIAAFEREAAVLRALSHSQIPAFVRAFTEGSGVGTRLYLAQEFIQGESLQQRVARQRLTEDEAWNLAEQALEVLHHLHTRDPRLVHRDVKPANLILRERGPMALVDFGAVRDLTRELTHGSTLVGTFGYMPPEQLGGTVDATSDLYALGATLLHGLTGIPPSDLLVDGMELKFDHKLQGVSGELLAFIKKLVAPRRSERFPSAQEALEALRARGSTVLKPDAVKRASAARAAQAKQPTGSGRRMLVAIIAGVIGSLVAAGGMMAFFKYRAEHSLVEQGPGADDTYIDHGGQGSMEHTHHGSDRLDHRYMRNSPDEKGFIQTRLAIGEQFNIPLETDLKYLGADVPDVVRIVSDIKGYTITGQRPGSVRLTGTLRSGGQMRWAVTVEGAGQ